MRACSLPATRLSVVVIVLSSLAAGVRLPGGERPASLVEVERIGVGDVAPTADFLGAVEPFRASLVAAWIDGYVVEYAVREGDRVERGDTLVKLSDELLQLELAVAEGSLEEMRELLQKGKLDLARARELVQEKAVSQENLDEAVTQERILRLRSLQQEARIRVLRKKIERKTVKAPFAGEVVREHTQVGEWLQLGAPVARVIDLSRVYVRVHIPERQLRFLKERQKASVRIAAAAEKRYEGVVVAIGGEGDFRARTFPVRIALDNDGTLRAGMSARVELPVAEPRSALLLSKDAVLLKDRQSYVYVVKDGAAVVRAIETGVASGGRLEVVSGLEAGVPVVVKGNERLSPGARVRVRPDAVPGEEEGAGSPRAESPASEAGPR